MNMIGVNGGGDDGSGGKGGSIDITVNSDSGGSEKNSMWYTRT